MSTEYKYLSIIIKRKFGKHMCYTYETLQFTVNIVRAETGRKQSLVPQNVAFKR